MASFRPPWLLSNRHVQSILPGVLRWQRPAYRCERWEMPGNDFIDVAWAGDEDADKLLVLFHGLEGNCEAHYARRLGMQALGAGWRFAVPHFRGCSGTPNRSKWGYHAGVSDDVGWMLNEFKVRHGGAVYAAGVSLGANALLKWLGEQGERAGPLVRRAAAISATFDLAATGATLARFPGRLYGAHFLADDLRTKAVVRLGRFPGIYDENCVYAAATLRDFDDAVTAPLYGFRDVRDYYAQCSAGPRLADVRVPTLVLNARDDPFMPDYALQAAETLRAAGKIGADVKLDFQDNGGHAGFLGGDGWLPRHVLEFLSAS